MTGDDQLWSRAELRRTAGPYLTQEQVRTVHSNAQLLHGPEALDLAENEVVVVCLVRDGRPYVDDFIWHYLSLGAAHIVFMDNGSVDGTVEAVREHENVTVLRSDLPFKHYKIPMKRYLVERFGQGRWSLCVDIDEMFDWPYSDVVTLGSLIRYLGQRKYTAVLAQMLDMFPDRPLGEDASEDASLRERHRFYDLSDIHEHRYEDHNIYGAGNVVSNDRIRVLSGGIRKTVFNATVPLTKHPLVFLDGEVRPLDGHIHRVSNARVADFTCVLYHYKFLDGFYEQSVRAVREGNYFNDSGAYKRYLAVLEENPDLRIRRDTSRKLTSVNDLVDDRFLVVSEEYMAWAAEEARKNSDDTAACYQKYRAPGALSNATEQVEDQAREASELRVQITQLERDIAGKQRELEDLASMKRNLARQLQALEHEMRELRSSKKWRLICFLGPIKAKASSVSWPNGSGRTRGSQKSERRDRQ